MSTSEGQPETTAPQQPDASASESRLANRYGAPKRSVPRRARIIGAGVAVAAAVVAVAVYSIPSSAGTVSFKDVGFSFPEEGMATVEFNVDKSEGSTAACAVQVLNESYAIVGWKTVVLGPEVPETSTQNISVRIDSPAVTGGVNTCWIVPEDEA
ncbi:MULTISPECIES: DUF4307 domain-containing protein [Arthrobacter]|uniref:DUF4307 domain-containing protein n=1 Tax=Arthrobacter zhangbolii TaxID=2886936 RepID=A0A9X1S8S1_9MICC|nr:DUF4307 domain-containing protein [Arthrobacter sp. YD2]MCC3272905.1 DUF4307 domain-containing protein [Arthrobacter zhangbolii]MDN3905323.1 DUF4307 domain-containing protein [Arthrobacter sp. YD2]